MKKEREVEHGTKQGDGTLAVPCAAAGFALCGATFALEVDDERGELGGGEMSCDG